MLENSIPIIDFDTVEVVGTLNAKKAALVNLKTKIVENLIVVNSLEDVVPEGYKLVGLELIETPKPMTEEEKQLYAIIKEIDPNFEFQTVILQEPEIRIGETKWDEVKGFYLE